MVTNREPSSNGDLAALCSWAVSTTESWEKQTRSDLRRQKHRERNARRRLHQKHTLEDMQDELKALQIGVARRLAIMNQGSSSGVDHVHRLALESELLRRENLELREKLHQYDSFEAFALDATTESACLWSVNSTSQCIAELSRRAQSVVRRHQHVAGWWVRLMNGDPVLYFQPLSKTKFDCLVKACAKRLERHIGVHASLFGWTVHYAPLSRKRKDSTMVAHARFTTRVYCSLDALNDMLINSAINSWPVIATPPDWRRGQCGGISTQVLQILDEASHVMFYNVPGVLQYRYIQLVHRFARVRDDGKREIVLITLLAHAGTPTLFEENVKWITEGGTYFKAIEVNNMALEVTYDQWAACEDQAHGQSLFVQWSEYVFQRMQSAYPTRLLSS